MDIWDIETTAEREHVPGWLVEVAQLWTAESSAKYPEEYQEIRTLARAANVPPFVVVTRLFRDTYQITPQTTREGFHQAVEKQTGAHEGRMFLKRANPSQEEQARELEARTIQAAVDLEKAMDANDLKKLQMAAAIWNQSQEAWLMLTQGMTQEKAHAVMIGFAAAGGLNAWMEQKHPGPPPTVFHLYNKQR